MGFTLEKDPKSGDFTLRIAKSKSGKPFKKAKKRKIKGQHGLWDCWVYLEDGKSEPSECHMGLWIRGNSEEHEPMDGEKLRKEDTIFQCDGNADCTDGKKCSDGESFKEMSEEEIKKAGGKIKIISCNCAKPV